MKQGIFIALAALALAFASVPDTTAKAWGGWYSPNLNLKLAGSAFTVFTDDGVVTSLQNGTARGKYVRALVSGRTVAQQDPTGRYSRSALNGV